jgi:hypothetical protein
VNHDHQTKYQRDAQNQIHNGFFSPHLVAALPDTYYDNSTTADFICRQKSTSRCHGGY